MSGTITTTAEIGADRGVQVRFPTAILLLCLVLFAFAVRLVRLQSEPVWYDEAATIGIASMDWSVLFGEMARLESSPPGFYLLSKLWLTLFGGDIVWLRLLPAIAGSLAIVPVWLLARGQFGERTAWLAAGLIALAASHVRLSQDVRTYTVLFLCYCVAFLIATRLAERSPASPSVWRWMIGLGMAQGAMLWLHSTAPLLIMTTSVFVLVTASLRQRRLIAPLLMVIAAGVVTLAVGAIPLFHTIRHIIEPQFVDRWIDTPDLAEAATVYGRTLVAPMLHTLSPLAALVYAVMIAVAVVAALRRRDAAVIGLAVMLGAGLIMLPAVSRFVPVMLDRTVLFMLVPLLLLVAVGAASLSRPAFLVSAAVLLLLQALGTVRYQMLEVRKEQWPAAAAILHDRVGPQSPVIATEGVFQAIALKIPLRSAGDNPRIIVVPPEADLEQFAASQLRDGVIDDPAKLCSAIAGAERVWLVARAVPPSVANDPEYSSRGPVRLALRTAGASLIEHREVTGIEVEEWSSPHCR